MNLFSLDPGLAIWTWISFGILFLILYRYAFPSLLSSIKQREQTIADSVDKARAIEARLEEIEEERNEVIRKAREDADEILRKTRREADELAERLAEKARNEAAEIVRRAQEQAGEERRAAMEELRLDLANLICDSADAVVGKSFTGEKEKDWAREMVKAL